ncbi:hypothetical protein COO60DRAFT_1540022 [Scenedesmus sp. NREL 46B-D3]|nr:hypothetical protein COO60DRAFT_1540022 [Scenedesmus sp. NREL 46B-D3]
MHCPCKVCLRRALVLVQGWSATALCRCVLPCCALACMEVVHAAGQGSCWALHSCCWPEAASGCCQRQTCWAVAGDAQGHWDHLSLGRLGTATLQDSSRKHNTLAGVQGMPLSC